MSLDIRADNRILAVLTDAMAHNFLCISSYFKGADFLRSCHEDGNRVYLVTSESLRNKDWPQECCEEIFFMEETKPYTWNLEHLISGLSHLMRSTHIDRIVALDDFDVEKAAMLRETFRIPGMGQTTHRYFRDKLAMRMKAQDEAIPVPAFSSVFNDKKLTNYLETVAPPWVLKPRSEASATGIQKMDDTDSVWNAIHELGENRHDYLIEQFRPGKVYHVDTLSNHGEIIFLSASRYLNTPMEVAHGGGVFSTITLHKTDPDFQALNQLTKDLLSKFGLLHGASHSEFIKDEQGKWYFLETSSRVGGAFIAEKIAFCRGINLWREWAKIEGSIIGEEAYTLPKITDMHGGLLVSLTQDRDPDLSFLPEDDNILSIKKDHHIALTVRGENISEVELKISEFSQHVANHLMSVLPPSDQPTN